MADDPNPPAFPYSVQMEGYDRIVCTGATLRDIFAGLALNGLLADPTCTEGTKEDLAEMAFQMADAMLAERIKKAPSHE